MTSETDWVREYERQGYSQAQAQRLAAMTDSPSPDGAVTSSTPDADGRHAPQSEIRKWAAEHGLEVGARGAIPSAVREEYKRAQSLG